MLNMNADETEDQFTVDKRSCSGEITFKCFFNQFLKSKHLPR